MSRVWVVGLAALWAATPSLAQDLEPHFRKISDGVFVQTAREVNSNVGIILTSEGVTFDESGKYYTLLVERVGAMVKQGRFPNHRFGLQCAEPSGAEMIGEDSDMPGEFR
jgi:hypothetical protein